MQSFVDQEAKAREEKAAFDHQERFPQTPEDAVALLSERGYGSPEALAAAADGTKSALSLPDPANIRKANERHALGVLVAHRSAVSRQEPAKDPVYSLPNPSDPNLTMRHLTDAGPLAVAQFQREHPDDFERLRRVEDNRMAGRSRPLP